MKPRLLHLLTVLFAVAPVVAHPLDPLDKEEISATTAILADAGKVADSTRFVLIQLHEPPKDKILAFRPGQKLPRQAFAVLYDWASNTTGEAIVDLDAKKILSWKIIPKAQPGILPADDRPKSEAIVRADPGWRESMKKRGIKELDKIDIHGWPIGVYAAGTTEGNRRAFVTMFAREYGPIDDLIVVVDLTAKKIVKLEDKGVSAARLKHGDFAPLNERDEGKQAEGPPSQPPPQDARFQVHGNEVRWNHWRFRFRVHPRVGLILYAVGYEDEGKVRSILYRANLSEMVVPYGDPGPVHDLAPADDHVDFILANGRIDDVQRSVRRDQRNLIGQKEMLTTGLFVHCYLASITWIGAKVATFSSLETGAVALQKAHPSPHGGRGIRRVLHRAFRRERRRTLLPVVRSQGCLLHSDPSQMALQVAIVRA